MISYIVRRLLQGVVIILAVSFICFAIFQYLGDPVMALVGKNATQQQIREMKERLGLDKPFYIQYVVFLKNAVQGNFGISYIKQRPVMTLIWNRLPASIELASVGIFISFSLGTTLGVFTAIRPKSLLSRFIMAGSIFGISIPSFLIGLILILIFSVQLGILPPFGRGRIIDFGFWKTGLLTLDGWRHIIMPSITLGMYTLAMLLRLTRAEMVEVINEDYIRTARAKGLSNVKVIFKHALRNGLIPVITIASMSFGQLIAFSIVVETIFQWPGTGRLLLDSIFRNDQPIIVAYIILAAVIISGLNLIADLLYGILNPKIHYD